MAGLYIHIPFCASKCKYCDFASYADRDELMTEYVSAVIKEAKRYSGEAADTVFIGGGTPARLPLGEMTRLIEGIKSSIRIEDTGEFTIEVNPNSVSREKMREYAALGVNRISVGLQAAQERLLKRIGRTHTLKDFLSVIEIIKAEGIANINADMIYSLPGQNLTDAAETAELIASLDIPHISAYSLILEEGTPLYNEAPVLPDEDEDREMFYKIRDIFAEKGILRYEISNFAKKGYECKHNLKYWRVEDYIGLGAAAHSCYNGMRSYNSSSIEEYLRGEGGGCEPQDLFEERIMLKLRLKEGIPLCELPHGAAVDKLLKKYEELGLASICGGRLSLTDKGMDIQNSIVSDIYAAMES